jgi:anaerobic magnesium-protoporphyrin IX monomethyl ester cyclase
MNARYFDLEWFMNTKIKRIYPMWFILETMRLVPHYAKRKIELLLGHKTMKDYFREDLETGELCKGIT